MSRPIPSFQPVTTPEIQAMISDPKKLFDACDRAHVPLFITIPNQVESAIQSFNNVLEELSVPAAIYAAHKVTNSPAAIRSVNGLARIDIASPNELRSAIAAGFDSVNIIATGPKTNEFLASLVANDVTIAIDSYEELERLRGTLPKNKTQNVLLRLSRSVLNMPTVTRKSRFGLDQDALERAVSVIKADNLLRLIGLSFHLDTKSLDEKYYAITRALDELLSLQAQGFEAHVLDIGGGFGTDYGISKKQADTLVTHLKDDNASSHSDLTWQNFSYGLTSGKGAIKGIDIQDAETGSQRLRLLLDRMDESGQTLANTLSENLVELWIEPGSAVFSSSGVLVTKVIETKFIDGEHVVIIDAHRNQLCFENNEAPLDPIHLPTNSVVDPVDAFITGHLCIEGDFITFRKVHFDSMPESGDLLLWTHAGAYRSSFSTSQAIGHPLPVQVTYTTKNDNYELEESK